MRVHPGIKTLNFSYQVVPSFFIVDFHWQIFLLGESAGKSSKSGEASISSPSSPISNGSITHAWQKISIVSKTSRDHLTLRMWLLLLHHNFAIRISIGYYIVGHSTLLLHYELLVTLINNKRSIHMQVCTHMYTNTHTHTLIHTHTYI